MAFMWLIDWFAGTLLSAYDVLKIKKVNYLNNMEMRTAKDK